MLQKTIPLRGDHRALLRLHGQDLQACHISLDPPLASGCLFLAGAVGAIPLSIGRGDLALLLGLPFWAEGLAALLQGIWRRAKGRPLFKAGSLDAWLRRKGGPVSVFYVFCALALAGALAALRTAQL